MKMSSPALCAVALLACAVTFSAAQSSCKGRCGAEYYRGYMCQCDYTCLSYGECCKDFESQCTTKNSCLGRCGEAFKRGRLCSCDPDCVKYKQCCEDYANHCDAEAEMSGAASATAPQKTNSCDNVKDNKPQEPPVNEADGQTFSEGYGEDENLTPEEDLTSYPTDDPSVDTNNQVTENDDWVDLGDAGATVVPESTSGYGSTPAGLLDPRVPPEATLEPDTQELSTDTVTALPSTEATPSDNEPTQADDSLTTPQVSSGEPPTESTDITDPTTSTNEDTTLPESTTAEDSVSTDPTSAAPTELPPTASTVEPEALGQEDVSPDAQTTETPEAPSDEPEASVLTQDNTDVTPVPDAATVKPSPDADVTPVPDADVTPVPDADVTPVPDAATVKPSPDADATAVNPSPDADATDVNPSPDADATAVNPSPDADVTPVPDADATPVPDADVTNPEDATTAAAEPNALTTDIPSPTVAAQEEATTQAASDKPKEEQSKPKPQKKPEQAKPLPAKPSPAKPTPAKLIPKPEAKPVVDDTRGFQADDSNDTNLCSGRPVSGVTTLGNGTVAVFRGHYFWLLDRNRMPGPAQGITQVWGVPSPIDTVFTRCNCQGKTYIFKGPKYWRFENDVLDPGYPQVISTGFQGLRGHITAALSVPQHHRRTESVYFFKRGGLVQKYSYQSGTSPTCGRKPQVVTMRPQGGMVVSVPKVTVYTVRHRMVRQAVSALGPTINIRTSWRGFPSTITAAVSVPHNTEPDGYKYYVFSRSKSYNVRMDGARPVIAPPKPNTPPQSNEVFKCPKKV